MACPFFYPVSKLDSSRWRNLPRLPLGDAYEGICRSLPQQDHVPDEATLRESCSFGYARGTCERHPAGECPDAVRISPMPGDGPLIKLVYVLERAHAPLEHGTAVYSAADKRWIAAPQNEIVRRQAEVYAEGFAQRKYGVSNVLKAAC